jgi:glucan-binding YG repeat protein
MSKIQKYVRAMYAGGSMKDRRLDDFVSPVPKKKFDDGGLMSQFGIQPMQFNMPEIPKTPLIAPGKLELEGLSKLDTSGSKLLNMDINPAKEKTPLTGAQAGAIGTGAAAIGEGWEALADDQDATTWKAGEVGGSLLKGAGKGAAMGAALGPVGAAVGAGVGILTNAVSGLIKRGKAREEEEERKKEFTRTASKAAGQELLSSGLEKKQAESEASAENLASAYEKYGVKMEKGGVIKDKGLDKYYSEDYLRFKDSVGLEAGGLLRGAGSRPEDLKYIK